MATSDGSSSSTAVPDSIISQFCAVTGSDDVVARQMLDACGGNLDMAIGMHMDSGGETGVADPASAMPPPDDSVRAPIPQKREVLVNETFTFAPGLLNASALLGGTPVIGLRGRRRPARSVFDGFRDFQAEARQQELERSGFSSSGGSKRRTLEDLFRPPIDLMHKGSFHSARDAGTTESKWLMVNIQNVQEFQCQALNRDIWSHAAVKSIIQEHFIFWQVYHDSEEGHKYVQFYPVKEWPYVAILDPRTGENMVVWHQIDPLSFCDLVTNFLSEHPSLDGSSCSASSPPNKKVKRSDSIVDASEDSQLEAAIAASLTETTTPHNTASGSNDSESQSASEEENGDDDLETFTDSDSETPSLRAPPQTSSCNSSTPKGVLDKSRSLLHEHLSQSQDLSKVLVPETISSPKLNSGCIQKTHSVAAGDHTNSEKQQSQTESNCCRKSPKSSPKIEESKPEPAHQSWKTFLGDEKDDHSKLMMRFPDGKKQQLSIPCSSLLKALTHYVIEEGYSADRYELVTTFPKRKISQMDLCQTLQEVGLFPQETVFIQER